MTHVNPSHISAAARLDTLGIRRDTRLNVALSCGDGPATTAADAVEHGVICASRADVDAVASLASHHLRHHPVMRWLIPAPEDRREVLHAWYMVLAEHALTAGFVDLLADRSAAAIWLDRTQPVQVAGLHRRLAAACGRYAAAAHTLARVTEIHRPVLPHLHLAVLAVAEPGEATTLLAYRHRRLDRAEVSACAEAGTDEQFAMLLAGGYRPAHRFMLPAGPVLYPMVRRAAGPRVQEPRPARGGPLLSSTSA